MWWPMALGAIAPACGCRRRLDELHLVAFRIEHLEPAAAVRAVLARLPASSSRLAARYLRIPSALSVFQAVWSSRLDAGVGRQRQHFNILRGAESVAHALGIFGIRQLRRANDHGVVVLGGRRVRGVDSDVRDAGNLWARRYGLRRRCGRTKCGNEGNKKSGLHRDFLAISRAR